jgi:transposase
MPHRPKKKVQTQPVVFQPDSAGIDVGALELFVAVPGDRDTESVRSFGSFTEDLIALANWLEQCTIKTVAMESTGVYWIPLYQILQSRGIEVCLVNARHVKNVPGRKTDVLDCQWLQYLHSVGLLRASFRPSDQICVLRSYLRHRDTLVKIAASHIQHLQKALNQMNVHLHHVVSDITGVTGLAIIDAILAGERNPCTLASLRDRRIKATEATIAKALAGDYRTEHLFTLKQALEAYRFYQTQIQQADQQIESHLSSLQTKTHQPTPPPRRKHSPERNQPHFDLRGHLHRILGLDLTAIPGFSSLNVHTLFSEIGPDLSKFPSAKHFCSWLGLSPDNRISGGKILSAHTRNVKSRAASALRMAAYSAGKSYSAIGDYFRRLRARLGAPKAITATAHKLARIIFHLLTTHSPYNESVFQQNEHRYLTNAKRNLAKKARELGFSIHSIQEVS